METKEERIERFAKKAKEWIAKNSGKELSFRQIKRDKNKTKEVKVFTDIF